MGRWIALLLLSALFAQPAAGKGVTRMETLKITSPAFSTGGAIPAKYTCDGADVSPALAIAAVPAGTASLALIMDDPDAPMGTWVHWVVWNIPAQTREIPENGLPSGTAQGKTSWNRNKYGGPCPPSGTHRYFFKFFALDTQLKLGDATTISDLEKAMKGHILAKGELMGTYHKR